MSKEFILGYIILDLILLFRSQVLVLFLDWSSPFEVFSGLPQLADFLTSKYFGWNENGGLLMRFKMMRGR